MQQVNFYQDEFKKIEPPYSATTFVIVMVYCLIISIVIVGILVALTQTKAVELASYERQVKALNQQLELTRQQFPAPEISQIIVTKIELLKERKTRNKKVLTYLSTRTFDIGNQSFSSILQALTEVQQINLWLTEIELKEGGTEIKLTGRAMSADLLPKYLDKLAQLPVFSELEFEVFNMQRVDGQLQFVVSSKRELNDAQAILEKVTQNRK